LRADRAHDVLLDHDVGRAADDEEMLHVVAADQHEAPAPIDRRGIDDREPRLATAGRGIAEPLAAEPAHEPGDHPDQDEHHDEGNDEA
jgi:hypothetical protein